MSGCVRDLIVEGAHALSGDGRAAPSFPARIDAELLLMHVLSVPRAWLVSHGSDEIDAAKRATFEALIARRASGEPVAYITGVRGFHAIDLRVTPDVLIPRAETELLVDLALRRIPVDTECRVADLGTGSGAIALAIAQARPRAEVLATDASATALDVARGNAARLDLRNVAFAQGDWCVALDESRAFDLIVSNPPYIADDDPHLRQGDLRFEPHVALASGADGLDAIRVIVRDARRHLRSGGRLLLEHGFEQGAAVLALFTQHGYSEIFTERDLEGRERVSGGGLA